MVDIDSLKIPPEVLGLIPKTTAVELCALPLRVENDTAVVALPEGYDPQILTDLAFLLGKKIVVEIIQSSILYSAIQKHYGITTGEMKAHHHPSREFHSSEFVSVREEEKEIEASADGSAVTLVNRIITDAIHMGASDIHIEPYERTMRVRYRLDGVLHEVMQPSPSQVKPLISRLKIMADLDIAEKRRPQDGRIRVKQGDRVIDIRVSSLPTDFGEKIVLRILDKSQVQLDLTKLGFEPTDLKLFQRTIRLPYGMILVTGPTGSGKTTTLYAALNYINRPEINITTIEDPIEYNLHGINQTHVRSDIGLTFAATLRSILRQDPNVIMLGEIRDSETAEIAIRAALTGHLVFSTLHTNDAPSAVTRLIDMGIEPFLVASSVKMILAQRLLRRLCEKCKEPAKPTAEQHEEFSLSSHRRSTTFYKAKGCPACNHVGYKGRMAVYEVFPIQNGISDLIAKEITASELRVKAQENGLVTLREAALQRAERGETSLDEVIRETAG
ncbi:MAG: GspE/PulE family protein [Bacteroidota bacterium]